MKHIAVALLALAIIPVVSAELALNSISYDPAIIASGDTVDIVIQYRHVMVASDDARVNDPDWEFRTRIEPDDSLTEDYVTIQDAAGDGVGGSIIRGSLYNQRYRVKVHTDAPAGDYEFRLVGQWYDRGTPVGGEQFTRFTMPVKREGIVLDIASYTTSPADVRAGDEYVTITAYVENTGEKAAESIELRLNLPEGLEASHTDANRVWIGALGPGQSKLVQSYVDVDEDLAPEAYQVVYSLRYEDADNNGYTVTRNMPFLVRESPHLIVTNSTGGASAASTGALTVTIKNTGTEAAEAIDVRVLPQSSQPFTLDVRSQYLGELSAGEERSVVFDLDVEREARIGEHDLQILIRAKGDSDEGDDNIYTFTRRATFTVTGGASNPLLWVGAALLAGVLAIGAFRVAKR